MIDMILAKHHRNVLVVDMVLWNARLARLSLREWRLLRFMLTARYSVTSGLFLKDGILLFLPIGC